MTCRPRSKRLLGDEVIALTVSEAIDEIPGVTEQQTTFNQILGVTVVIALVVIALFFALLTVERTALYGVLKAIGARSRTIFAGLVVQAVVRHRSIAAVIAGVAVIVLDLAHPARFDPAVHLGRADRDQRRPAADRRRHRLRLLAAPGPPRRPGLCPREFPMTNPSRTSRRST